MNDFLLFMLGCLFILLLLILNEQDEVENFTSDGGGSSASSSSASNSSPKQAASKSKAVGYENSGDLYRMIGSSGDWLGIGKDIYPYAPVAL
jgi:hypothetical protein